MSGSRRRFPTLILPLGETKAAASRGVSFNPSSFNPYHGLYHFTILLSSCQLAFRVWSLTRSLVTATSLAQSVKLLHNYTNLLPPPSTTVRSDLQFTGVERHPTSLSSTLPRIPLVTHQMSSSNTTTPARSGASSPTITPLHDPAHQAQVIKPAPLGVSNRMSRFLPAARSARGSLIRCREQQDRPWAGYDGGSWARAEGIVG